MKKNTFVILFFLNILLSQAQQNTMRLGYPIGHSSSLENIQYSNDSKLILTISEDKKNIVWDVLTGRMLYVLPIQTNHFDDYTENQIFFASDNKQIISCTDNLLEFWDVKKPHRTKSISDVTFTTTKKVQSGDLHYLLMLKNNGKLQLYNYESDKLLYEFKDVFSDVAKIEFSPSGNFIIVNSDEQIRIFNSKSGTLHFQTNDYSQVRFSSDEKKIILENYHNSKIIDATSKNIIFESLESGFDSMYISSDGNYFSEFSDENLITKNIQTNQIVASFKTDKNGIFSTDNSGNDFWITANPQKIEIFNILNSKKNNSIDLSKISFGKDYLDISEIIFSPDKKSLAFTLYKDIRTIVVDLQSNSVRYVLEGKLDTNNTIVNQNSKHYNFTTTAWNHNSVQYWNPQTMSLNNTFSGKGDYISETIFSPNQNYIAVHSSSLDKQNQIPNYITIFNVDSGVEIFSVPTQGYELLDNFEFHPKYDNLALVKTVTSYNNSVIELLNLKTHHKTSITTENENSYFGFTKNGNPISEILHLNLSDTDWKKNIGKEMISILKKYL